MPTKLDIMRATGEKWEMINGKPEKIQDKKEIKVEGPVVHQKIEIVKSFEDELGEIKGIGSQTIQDIKRVYKDRFDLVESLKKDLVPLRNDVVRLLKQRYL